MRISSGKGVDQIDVPPLGVPRGAEVVRDVSPPWIMKDGIRRWKGVEV